MAGLLFNKTFLHQESAKLKRYRRYLPSLDLKRRQLIAMRQQAAHDVVATENAIRQQLEEVSKKLPMMSDTKIELADLVKIDAVKTDSEWIMGYLAPKLSGLEISIRPYSMFDLPPWVDQAVVEIKQFVELKIRLDIEKDRLAVFDLAVRKITQRLNLFDKVLIPKTEENIKKVRIFLSDAERTAMTRAKLTKKKRKEEVGD